MKPKKNEFGERKFSAITLVFLKYLCRLIANLFNEGLNFSLFIDVSDTQLHYLTVWKTKKDWEISFKKAKEYSDVKAQVKEMGATMSIVGGETSGRMTSKSNFNLFENVSL